ncbi:hypothetical protein DUI87_24432 [Hirundo rustica rustica]|uniref:Uncharacterized protein n=1 Tax=Hirundo rustica rustica TaxID=333673 RepID=A0A3M0JDE7_HIRRU|nr:hypothetical protein DUI87_24432 [Hirundo rustica rustica]
MVLEEDGAPQVTAEQPLQPGYVPSREDRMSPGLGTSAHLDMRQYQLWDAHQVLSDCCLFWNSPQHTWILADTQRGLKALKDHSICVYLRSLAGRREYPGWEKECQEGGLVLPAGDSPVPSWSLQLVKDRSRAEEYLHQSLP